MLGVLVCAAALGAAIPEPLVLYGTLTVTGRVLTAADTACVVEARRASDGTLLASYALGSDPAVADLFYALRLELYSTTPTAATAVTYGEVLRLVLRENSLELLRQVYTISERGVVRLDFGAPADTDGDGIPDAAETASDPNLWDTDGDGMPDGWETAHGLNPNLNDAGGGNLAAYTAACVVYVKGDASGSGNGSSWTNAFTSLTTALAATTLGQEIWVASGTYKPGGASPTRSSTFQLLAGVPAYGGFAGTEAQRADRNVTSNPTVLSGDIGTVGVSTDNCYHVVTGANCVLDGFIIRDGRADGSAPHNAGGGLLANGVSTRVANCRFVCNRASGGGGAIAGNHGLTVANSVFIGNAAALGGALYVDGGTPLLVNCTLTANTATTAGGALYSSAAAPLLVNSILRGNSPTEVAGSSTAWTEVSFCAIQGGWAGLGGHNLGLDPRFVRAPSPGADGIWGGADDDLGDVQLGLGSPVIDYGSDAALPPGLVTDLAGRPRLAGAAVDLGAYESWDTGTPPPTGALSTLVGLGSGQLAATPTLPVVFTVHFSRSVTGFGSADVIFGGTGAVQACTLSGNAAEYEVRVTAMSVPGSIVLSVAAAVAVDGDGIGNAASNTVAVLYDAIAPVAPVITAPADDSTVNQALPPVSGTAEPGETPDGDVISVTVRSDVLGVLGSTTVDASGHWSLTPVLSLSETTHELTATASDAAGNTGPPSAPVAVTVHLDPYPAAALSNQILYVWGEAELNGVAVPAGSIVAVFSSRDVSQLCGKGTVGEGGVYGMISVYGYDQFIDTLPHAGDTLRFEIWDCSNGAVYPAKTAPASPTWTANNAVLQVDLSAGGLDVALHQGWNLIGSNIDLCWYAGASADAVPSRRLFAGQALEYVGTSMATAAPLADLAGKYTRITGFDADGGHLFDRNLPQVATLKYLAGGYGYWIYMTAPALLQMRGPAIAPDASTDLRAGWQLLTNWTGTCYYVNGKIAPTAIPAPDGVSFTAVNGIAEVFAGAAGHVRVTGYDAEGGHVYDSLVSADANSLHYLSPGYGYWIYLDNALPDFRWP